MRLKFVFSFLILGTALILISCNGADTADNIARNNVPKPPATTASPASGTETTYADGVRRVTPNELETMMKNGEVFVVDVRSQAMFDAGHIPGAKLIPVGEVANRVSEFPRNKLIVTYCSWPKEQTSAGAVVTLKQKGIENGAALLGGFQAWQQQGKPVDKK